jgi:hypothetical protein
VEGVTVPLDRELARYCRLLTARLAFTGVGCMQFIRTPSGAVHFLEPNPRLGANFAVVDRCGLDLTALACALAAGTAGGSGLDDFRYEPGVRYSWTFGDIRGLRRAVRRREIGAAQAVDWLVRAIRSAAAAEIHLTWSVRDPHPTLAIFRHWAPAWLKPLFGPAETSQL